MRIGDAAAAVGATPRALRLYEQRGLLDPPRTPSGQREYGAPEMARLRAIRLLLSRGLTIGDLRGIAHRLPLVDAPTRCAAADTGEGAVVVLRRIAVLDAEIGRLTRLRDALRDGFPAPGEDPRQGPA